MRTEITKIEKFYDEKGKPDGWIVVKIDKDSLLELNRFGPFRTKREAKAEKHD